MSLKHRGNIDTGDSKVKIIDHFYMTDAEAAVVGRAYKLTTARWTKAATTDRIYAICIKATVAGTDVLGTMALVKSGDIIEADYTGTADAAFIEGLELAVLDANGDNVDAATVTGGHLVVINKDAENKKVKCVALKNFTQAD